MDEKWVRDRLEALHGELAAGDQMLAELAQRQSDVREDMLRIGGAVTVLEELLAQTSEPVTDRGVQSSWQDTS